MRPAETISMVFLAAFAVVAVMAPIATARRIKAVLIGSAGMLIAWLLPTLEGVPGGPVVRDFVPGFLLLVAYWQTGQFVVGSNARFQSFLERFDQRWFPGVAALMARVGKRRTLSHYLELAYMACYPVVPMGVAALYLLGRSGTVDQFWRVVLPATFLTHGLTTVFQSWPPWMMDSGETQASRSSGLKAVNQWVTDTASIRANSFPSGHVASSFAIAFVLLAAVPVAGIAFLWVAASIAASSVLLRYHYVLDVILGIGLAAVSYLLLA